MQKVIALLLVSSIAVLAAGCGKDKPDPTTAWANDLCSSITTWEDSITATASSVTSGNLSKEGLKSAAQDAKEATTKLADDVKSLGKPPTESGDQAKQALNELATEIDTGVQTVTAAAQGASGVSGILSAISVASQALVTMNNEVSSTVDQLKQLSTDANGELKNAFNQADSCKELRTTTSTS
jgi:hypothetical protein